MLDLPYLTRLTPSTVRAPQRDGMQTCIHELALLNHLVHLLLQPSTYPDQPFSLRYGVVASYSIDDTGLHGQF